MKKFTAFIFCVCIALTFSAAACKGGGAPVPTPKPSAAPVEITAKPQQTDMDTETPAQLPAETQVPAAVSAAEIEQAERAARAYYAGTVFEVVSMEAESIAENEIVFDVCVKKGGVVQEPNRSITMQKADGVWIKANEGF